MARTIVFLRPRCEGIYMPVGILRRSYSLLRFLRLAQLGQCRHLSMMPARRSQPPQIGRQLRCEAQKTIPTISGVLFPRDCFRGRPPGERFTS